MKLFRTDNTQGYSQKQLDKLNDEWEQIVEEQGLEEYTDNYDREAKAFCDEVSRR